MGSYREEYESYYSNILGKKIRRVDIAKDEKALERDIEKNKHNKTSSGDIIRYFININVTNTIVCLFIGTLLVTGGSHPKGMEVYNYIKQVSKVNFYYKDIIGNEVTKSVFNSNEETNKIQNNIGNNEVKEIKEDTSIVTPFNDFEVVTKASSEILKESSVLPIGDKVSFGEVQGIKEEYVLLISDSNDTSVKSICKGIVKELGTDEEIGDFLVLDLGGNLNIKYGNLKSVVKEVGQDVNAGDVVAELNKSSNNKINGLVVQVIEGGEYKNPKDYINFK